jgi:oligopeptide transport system substrate-binding protein
MKRIIVACACTLLVLLAITPDQTSSQDNAPPRITVAIPGVSSIDPTALPRFATNEQDVIENLFIGLTRLNALEGAVEPYLATDWTVSENGLVWTFNLRDDVQWMEVTDGEAQLLRPVVAADVVFAIQRACDPTRPSPATDNIYVIAGCRTVQNLLDHERIDQDFLNAQIGARAINDTTLEITLAFPASYFLTLTTLPEFRPLPAERVRGAGAWPTVATVATSGPWAITNWDTDGMQLDANPAWPLERTGNVQTVDISFSAALDSIPLRLSSGTLTAARLQADDVATLQFAENVVVDETSGPTRYLLGFSYEYNGLNNPLVRRALAQAIDRTALANTLQTLNTEAYREIEHLTPGNVVATPTATGLGFDITTAQQTLAAAGFARCQGLPRPLTLVVHNDPVEVAIGQFIVGQWNQNLGCTDHFVVGTAPKQAVIDTAHGTVDVSEDGNPGRFQLWLVTWTADYPDADAWLAGTLHCSFGFFRPGRTCNNVDTLLDQATRLIAPRDRSLNYTQAELALFGAEGTFPIIPLVETIQYSAHQRWVGDVAAFGPFQFDRWQVTPTAE